MKRLCSRLLKAGNEVSLPVLGVIVLLYPHKPVSLNSNRLISQTDVNDCYLLT